jgi:hypothetical protein
MHRSMIASCLSTSTMARAIATAHLIAVATESPLLRLDPRDPTQVPPGDLGDAVGPTPDPFGDEDEGDEDYEGDDEGDDE